ncbi:hypothetical protein FJQ98_07855 [Lysinibacillus agricola]|uniref:Uncharacterized protein n=1 Tax=Lysinibacillus agricola TaxID=2590012 RepID=A0ABX7AXD5_9BACI|nr:hypothetical protein [Lysinibacillus agricola]KOS62967.1 hypothetical protein AN161_11760 [Lysinibacillus sp. FJAT-14222]QQP13937.1 hypothetical protein FJQ98_07855 [Lysinibacillus agricola]
MIQIPHLPSIKFHSNILLASVLTIELTKAYKFAMETFTEFSRDGKIDIDLSEINPNDISEHLYVKKFNQA